MYYLCNIIREKSSLKKIEKKVKKNLEIKKQMLNFVEPKNCKFKDY